MLLPSAGSATTVCRAMSLARSQFTGPPSKESIWPSCWKAAPRSLGLRPPNIAAKGLSPAPGAPGPPAPGPPGMPGRPMPNRAPSGLFPLKPKDCGPVGSSPWSFFFGSLSGLALPSSGSSGGTPNPKGRSLTGSSIRSAVIRVVAVFPAARGGRRSWGTPRRRAAPGRLYRAGCTAGPQPRAGWTYVTHVRTHIS